MYYIISFNICHVLRSLAALKRIRVAGCGAVQCGEKYRYPGTRVPVATTSTGTCTTVPATCSP